MSRSVRTPAAVAATALLLVTAAASGAAAADGATQVQVSANNNPGSRQFFVEDLTGKPLTRLDLGTGAQGLPFQTRVKDTDYTSNNGGFVAGAEMTNLYRKGATIEYGTKVDSRKLSISYAGIPSDVSGLALGALPKIAISGVLPLCKDLACPPARRQRPARPRRRHRDRHDGRHRRHGRRHSAPSAGRSAARSAGPSAR